MDGSEWVVAIVIYDLLPLVRKLRPVNYEGTFNFEISEATNDEFVKKEK